MNTDTGWRYSFLGALFSVLPVLIVLQIVRIQASPTQVARFLEQSEMLSSEYRLVTPARGQIYDRWGNLLAGNKTVYEVGVELQYVRSPETIAQTAAVVLGVDYADAFAAASTPASETAVYAVLADNVSKEKIDNLQIIIEQMEQTYSVYEKGAPSLDGLTYSAHLARTYPEKSLGSNILGFVSREGQGYFGVEEKYNDLLAGKPRMVRVPLDPIQVNDNPEVPDGASLVLTIDRTIQRTMEDVLAEGLENSGAKSGAIVVIDPKSGEILAMATSTVIDLNEYWQYLQVFNKDTPFNRGVSNAYEPGSVYKVLTMAAALDKGAVKPETVFIDTGVFEYGGTYVYNWNGGAWGPQDMQGCMQHSLNVCLSWISTQLGTQEFYRYMQAFGIGRLTGIDLAGENPGRLKTPGDEDWYDADLVTNSFGQGVSATPVQMAVAISSVANDGKIMLPHVVRSVVDNGFQYDIEQHPVGMPIRAETAHTLTELLARSLETESSDALVTGYRVAGKTGTAEIPTPFGYTSNATNASFVGWGPADDPRFLIYVWLERPSASPWGSVVAAPVFSRAVEKLVMLIDLPPDEIRQQLLPTPTPLPTAVAPAGQEPGSPEAGSGSESNVP